MMWTVAGALCIVVGFIIGPSVARAHKPWFTMLLGCLVYAFSLLLCRVVLITVWRRAEVLPPVLFFSLPVGGMCLIAAMVVRLLAPALELGRRTLFISALSMGLLYGAALVWGIGVGLRRKAMGNFEVDNRP